MFMGRLTCSQGMRLSPGPPRGSPPRAAATAGPGPPFKALTAWGQTRASGLLPASEPRALRPEEAGGSVLRRRAHMWSASWRPPLHSPGWHPERSETCRPLAWSIHRHVLLKTMPVLDPVRCCASHNPTRQVLSSFYRERDQDWEQASHTRCRTTRWVSRISSFPGAALLKLFGMLLRPGG